MNAYDVHAHEVYPHGMHARKMHTHEMYAHEIHAREVHAREVQAHETHAYEIHAREMHAREVQAHETLTNGGAVVDLSRSELAKTSFCASAGWSLWRAARAQDYFGAPVSLSMRVHPGLASCLFFRNW
jgi:hypothetical protein